MSSNTKDPLQQQDTPSESSESPSDSEVNETEENLEHLKIQERQARDDSEESKHSESPDQEGILASGNDPLDEPIAGPSGLPELSLDTLPCSSDSKSKFANIADPQIGTDAKTEDDLNIEERLVEGQPNATNRTPAAIQSSTEVNTSSLLDENLPVAGPSRPRRDIDYSKLPAHLAYAHFVRGSSRSSISRRFSYASDSANTSSDVSDLRSEAIIGSADESVYHDAPDGFERDDSPSYASAVERQTSESSDTNISEIQDDMFPPPATPSSSSFSISTPSGEQGGRGYLAQIEREADARGEQLSTSSGIGSTDQSQLAGLKDWYEAGAIGFERRHDDDPHQNVPDQAGEPLLVSESTDSEGYQQIQDFDRLFQQEHPSEGSMERPNVPDDAMRGCIPRRTLQAYAGAGSPSKRRRQSRCSSDSSREEKGPTEKPKPRFKYVTGKKSKAIPSKLTASQSSSESTEPKSSSSNDSHRTESGELESSSESKEFSKFDMSRKSWQKSGRLRSMQISTMSSKDSIITEEDAVLEEKDPESMETSPEKDDKESDKAKPSESQPSIEFGDQACGFQTAGTSREHELSFDVSDFERSVGKSKRESKLSNSPPSEEMASSSPPKAAARRLKKKARADKTPGKTRRTRRDSGGTVPKALGLENPHQSESTSTPDPSDYSASEGEH